MSCRTRSGIQKTKYMKLNIKIFLSIISIFAVFAFLRFSKIYSVPVFVDEAIYVRWSQIMKAEASLRFLPMFLHSLPAIGGMTHLALERSPLISPLAMVLIGGLISSTLLSRLITPVLYYLIPPVVETKEAAISQLDIQNS